MSNRKYITGSSSKMFIITLVMVLCFGPDSFGRKLYSIGSSAIWNSSSAWSLTSNGSSAGLVPQSTDTVIIDRKVVLNANFIFSDKGILTVTNTGSLRGDNFDLGFNDNASVQCAGEIKTNNFSLTDDASLTIETPGVITILNNFTNNSLNTHSVFGKLSITGSLINGSSSVISGSGIIESVHYEGNGMVFNINSVSAIPDGSLITACNWIGSVNSDWREAANWSGGIIPQDDSQISILAVTNYPKVTDLATCNNLYINTGSTMVIDPSAVLDVTGNLKVIGTGKLLLKNTIVEKSSLILNGDVSGQIQSEYPVVAGQKSLFSSPVGSALSSTFLNMYLRTYNEASSQWGEYIVPTTDPLQIMRGYEVYSLFSETRTFVGTPEHEAKSYSISNAGNGLNLTGNPYPCFIDWENSDAWQRNTIASAIYYPDPSGSGNFSVYLPGNDDAVSLNNGSRYIAPMQGFFVKASGLGSITVNKNSRVRSTGDSKIVLKNNSVKLRVKDSDGLTDEVMFRVLDNSTFEFDEQLDALKLKGNDNAPFLQLESSSDDVKYAVNTIPAISSSLHIPLNIACAKAGMFTLSAAGCFDFQYRFPVILEDKELGTTIDLRNDSSYSFYHSPEMNSSRFEIHFYSPDGISEQNDFPVEIITIPGEVKISGFDKDVYTANLYNAEGKLIDSAKGMLSDGISLSSVNQQNSICILQLFNAKNKISKKIVTK